MLLQLREHMLERFRMENFRKEMENFRKEMENFARPQCHAATLWSSQFTATMATAMMTIAATMATAMMTIAGTARTGKNGNERGNDGDGRKGHDTPSQKKGGRGKTGDGDGNQKNGHDTPSQNRYRALVRPP